MHRCYGLPDINRRRLEAPPPSLHLILTNTSHLCLTYLYMWASETIGSRRSNHLVQSSDGRTSVMSEEPNLNQSPGPDPTALKPAGATQELASCPSNKIIAMAQPRRSRHSVNTASPSYFPGIVGNPALLYLSSPDGRECRRLGAITAMMLFSRPASRDAAFPPSPVSRMSHSSSPLVLLTH